MAPHEIPQSIPDERRGNRFPAPRTLYESGLTLGFASELIGKILFTRGRERVSELSKIVKLPISVLDEVFVFMRAQHYVEVRRVGASDAEAQYHLSESGRARAIEALERNHYAGVGADSILSHRADLNLSRG
ncbi:MAG: hypothetical protein U1E86_27015 [Burkholderiaceae bacterium]